ncbi:alpha/beta hydrolase [Streptomyces sp. NPDC054784]
MDYQTLRALDPGEFEDAAGGYRGTSEMAGQSKDSIDHEITARMRTDLAGQARDAALGQLRQLSRNFHYAQVECGLVSAALRALAADFRAAKATLDGAVADARAQKLTVNPDGSVTFPAGGDAVDGEIPAGGTVTGTPKGTSDGEPGGGPGADAPPLDPGGTAGDLADALERQAAHAHPNPHYGAAVAYADRIATAVHEATEADEKWAPKLRKLRADDDLTVSHADWADAGRDLSVVRKGAADYLADINGPPPDGTPKENAEWWRGLTAEERDAYVTLDPASVGRLDGVPATVRDEANRTVLAETRGTYELERAAIPPEPARYASNPNGSYPAAVQTAAWTDWNAKHGARKDYLDRAITAMQRIDDPFEGRAVPQHKKLYVLDFDASGDGKAVVALGDPDAADHTAVFVPGTNTEIEGLDGQIERVSKLQDAAMDRAPGESVSTISWLGYDAPEFGPADDHGPPEVNRDVAGQGRAEDGARDLRSFTEGLRQAREDSPGHLTVVGHSYGTTTIGVAAREGQGLHADEIIALGSPGMGVDHAAELQMDPQHVWIGSTQQDPVVKHLAGFTLGENPAMTDFGGQPMKVNDGGHSSYWDEDRASLRNQGRIIAGLKPELGPFYERGVAHKPVDIGPDGHHPVID